MAVEIGGADGGGYTRKKNFKLKDGNGTFRILPSLGFNGKKPNGKWAVFYNVHFGYKTSEGKMRTFQSPLVKNRDTKMVEKPDAALERIEKLKAELKKVTPEKGQPPINKPLFDKLTALVGGAKPTYNMDNNHHVNAINENGEIGILKLRHKAKLALDLEIAKLRAKGIEPLGADNGRFFVFSRSGNALETTFSVSTLTKTITVPNIGEVQQDIVHVLTPEIISRLEAEAGDLNDLYQRPTSEEVARIVAESDLLTGRSAAVDEILDRKSQAADETPEGEEEPMASAPVSTAQQAAAPTPTPPAITQGYVPPSTPTTAVQIQSPPPPVATASVSELSDDEFLKSLGA